MLHSLNIYRWKPWLVNVTVGTIS